MNAADWLAIALIALTALGGLRRGFVGGALALAGLVAGALVGAKLAPALLGHGSPYVPFLAFAGAVVAGSAGHVVGGLVGRSAETAVARVPAVRVLDRAGGTALGVGVGLALCWVVGAVLLYAPGQTDLRRLAQGSFVLSSLTAGLPPERVMGAVGRIDPFAPLIGPVTKVDAPEAGIVREPHIRAARASVVRVRGTACGLSVEGSGWIVRPGIVVTNAHVVAGIAAPLVDRGDGRVHPSRIVGFDARNDVAVLRVAGLGGRALEIAGTSRGKPAALLGFPQNGPYKVTPVRMGTVITVTTTNAYGRVVSGRRILTLRGAVRSGNSGGPIVGRGGRVVATVFATRRGSEHGYAVPNLYVRRVLGKIGPPLRTPCVTD